MGYALHSAVKMVRSMSPVSRALEHLRSASSARTDTMTPFDDGYRPRTMITDAIASHPEL